MQKRMARFTFPDGSVVELKRTRFPPSQPSKPLVAAPPYLNSVKRSTAGMQLPTLLGLSLPTRVLEEKIAHSAIAFPSLVAPPGGAASPSESQFSDVMTSTPYSICSTVDLDATPYASMRACESSEAEFPRQGSHYSPEERRTFVDDHTEVPRDLFEELVVRGEEARARGCHVVIRGHHSHKDELVR